MEQKEEQPCFSSRTYIIVWAALLLLLAMTIAVSRIGVTAYGVVVNLLIATVKAGLVLFFFMNLKHEGRLIRWMLLLSVSMLTLVITLTFSDTWFR